jgi:hypothetical protein
MTLFVYVMTNAALPHFRDRNEFRISGLELLSSFPGAAKGRINGGSPIYR